MNDTPLTSYRAPQWEMLDHLKTQAPDIRIMLMQVEFECVKFIVSMSVRA
ncbi:uncharacterized protein LACBIDRAFT_302312 [Laccaria bicolor S238N-H82]|uniref:Predicted protein n=1 Tax=Laccaria bicolor (strain S238N-H82 / ATCC MYA-4686) TaxID=486041 RepID=B0DHI6_LACBS|nr:uncharacterized protein LACBIDRAFT_302312 [Laccaria bicolor S238N-H82]EDR06111.1 predicted protein [Laccaria bicolor S238N-H82]|eukprot:XP_001883399.1 predicted protein [Laccaria bicolor S238N-H82]